MGDYHAIAAVTATLVSLIHSGIQPHLPGVTISTQRPKKEDPDSRAQVNIFLYHVTPNPSLRNIDLPTWREDGSLAQTPRLALDLHYLITFYGNQSLEHLQPQVLLGLTLDTLHVHPFLTTAEVLEVLSSHRQFGEPSRIVREAAQRVEQIILSDVSMELEALSRLWSMAFQVPYALSVAYKASAAILTADLIPQPVLPALGRSFAYFQIRAPLLNSVAASVDGEPDPVAPIFSGSRLILQGQRLQADEVTVAVGPTRFDVPGHQVTESRIDLALDPHVSRGGPLESGHLATRVIANQDSPSEPLVIVLRPRIDGARVVLTKPENGDLEESPAESRPNGAADEAQEADKAQEESEIHAAVGPTPTDMGHTYSGRVEVDVRPRVARDQEVELLLNQLGVPAGRIPYSFSFRVVQQEDDDVAVVPFEDVPAGVYLLRLRIGGAESVPTTGPADVPRAPLSEPQITIPPRPASPPEPDATAESEPTP